MEQRLPPQQMVLEQLDSHMQNKEPDTETIYALSQKTDSKWITDVKLKTINYKLTLTEKETYTTLGTEKPF